MDQNETKLPADLQKRYDAATNDTERLAIMNDFANSLGAAETRKENAVLWTDDQFNQFLRKVGDVSAENAKGAIKALAGETERKYNLSGDESQEIAERSFEKTAKRMENEQSDLDIAAQVFRGMFLARTGKPQEYANAIQKEADHYKRVYGRETRAMSLGTDSTAGYLAPTLFSDMLYENISRYSLVRKFATIINMNRNEIINFPVMTSTPMAASQVSEATGSTGTQGVFTQKQLTTKKLMSKSKPISLELIEKANPAIIKLLLDFATVEILKAEDNLVFSASGNGIRNSSTNLVTVGSVATSSTDYSSIEYDDMISMESALAAQYLIGEDVQGSGIINGAPRYFMPHGLKQQLKSKKDGTGRYLDETRDLRNDSQIFGWGVSRALTLPDGTALSALDKVAIFGNLAHVWCGIEPGFRVDILDQGSVDDGGSLVSLADTGQAAVRVIEFFDNVVIDSAGFSIASMGA